MKMAKKHIVFCVAWLLLLSIVLTGCVYYGEPTDPVSPVADTSYVAGELSEVEPHKKGESPDPGEGGSGEGENGSGEAWEPFIEDTDPDRSLSDDGFDDSASYTYSNEFFSANGDFIVNEGTYTSTAPNSMMVVNSASEPFPYGTISCTITSNNQSDTGIVFGLSSNNTYFWENGVSYYFYFLNKDGNAYLGKVDNGWAALSVVSTGIKVQENTRYELKVVFKSNVIWCYFNGELMFAYRDDNVLKGTGYGIRTGMNGATFSDFTITNEYLN